MGVIVDRCGTRSAPRAMKLYSMPLAPMVANQATVEDWWLCSSPAHCLCSSAAIVHPLPTVAPFRSTLALSHSQILCRSSPLCYACRSAA